MRFLTHRIVTSIPENKANWHRIKLNNTIFLNAPREFYDFVYEKRRLSDLYIPTSNSYSIYYNSRNFSNAENAEDNYVMGSTIIVLEDYMPQYNIIELEGELLKSGVVDHDDLIIDGKDSKKFYISVFNKWAKVQSSERNIVNLRSKLINASRELEENVNGFSLMQKRYGKLKKLGLLSGKKEFIFENVTAEDTNALKPDIELGTLKFVVDFNRGTVILADHPDSRVRYTPFNSRSKHPHQMETGLCLGTQEADFNMALDNWDVSIVEALLYKFAHSYNSVDGAGNKYNLWLQDMVIHRNGGLNILRENAVHSELAGGWLNRDEAVELHGEGTDKWYYKSYCKFSSLDNKWYLDTEVVLSNALGTYIPLEGAIELEEGKGFVTADFENMIQYRRRYYHIDDTVLMADSRRVPKAYVEFSVPMDQYILRSSAIQHENAWYTREALDAHLATLSTTDTTTAEVVEVEESEDEDGEVLSHADEVMARILADGGSMTDVYRNLVG